MTVDRIAEGPKYAVASDAGDDVVYEVDVQKMTCTCPARGKCKHKQAVLRFIEKDPEVNAPRPTSKPADKEILIKGRYQFGEVTSAMQKEIRKSDVEAAVFWEEGLSGQ